MDDNTLDKLKSLLNNENIPNELKNVLLNMNSSNNSSTNSTGNSNSDSNSNSNSSPEHDSNLGSDTNNGNIDFETIMRLKSMMDKMKSTNDPRSQLLISLKPYLKDSRKEKIDQYIQFLNLSKVFNLFSKSEK